MLLDIVRYLVPHHFEIKIIKSINWDKNNKFCKLFSWNGVAGHWVGCKDFNISMCNNFFMGFLYYNGFALDFIVTHPNFKYELGDLKLFDQKSFQYILVTRKRWTFQDENDIIQMIKSAYDNFKTKEEKRCFKIDVLKTSSIILMCKYNEMFDYFEIN